MNVTDRYFWLFTTITLTSYSLLNMIKYTFSDNNFILLVIWSILFLINFRNSVKNIINIIEEI